MKNIKQTPKLSFLVLALVVISITSCKKSSYIETGLAQAKFNGTMLQYLKSNPLYFDTLNKVIKLADMEDVFDKENITFFAPPDPTIQLGITKLNQRLLTLGRDTVSKLEDIKPKAWRALLSLYTFKGTNRLKDYTQVDTMALDTYSGQAYLSYNNVPFNIGVIYNNAVNGDVTVKYAGYRRLMISYIPDWTNPKKYWINTLISSSDINPNNGIVHALRIKNHVFGFHPNIFTEIALSEGIGN